MKTIHILRCTQEAPLRDAIQLQLNRGEFRHVLAKSLFLANWGSFRSGDDEEVMNKASCLSLLSTAVLVWNTVQIARIVAQLRAAGHQIHDEDVAARLGVSPAAVAITWTMRDGRTIPIPEPGSPGHVRENAAAGSLRLSEDDLAELDRAFPA